MIALKAAKTKKNIWGDFKRVNFLDKGEFLESECDGQRWPLIKNPLSKINDKMNMNKNKTRISNFVGKPLWYESIHLMIF